MARFGLFGGAGLMAGQSARNMGKDMTADRRHGVVGADQGPQPRRGLFGRARSFLARENEGVSNMDRLRLAAAYMRDDPSFALSAERGLAAQRDLYERNQAQQAEQEQAKAAGLTDQRQRAERFRVAQERGYSPEMTDLYVSDPETFNAVVRQNNEAFTLSDGQQRFGGAFGGQAENPDEMLPFEQDASRANTDYTRARTADIATDNARADAEANRTRSQMPEPDALRQEFEDDYARPYEQAQDQFMAMRDLAGDETGASDTALIFSFFKTIDPNSTVREGEFALAAQAMGLSDRLIAQMQRVDDGQILVGNARQELVRSASRALEQRANTVGRAVDRYAGLAGENASWVVRNPVADGLFEAPGATSGGDDLPVYSPEEAAGLPSGTRFRGTDGIVRVKE